MKDLIEQLERANQQLIGSAESHQAIAKAIEHLKDIEIADSNVRTFLPVMEASRPLVQHLEQLKDYARDRKLSCYRDWETKKRIVTGKQRYVS